MAALQEIAGTSGPAIRDHRCHAAYRVHPRLCIRRAALSRSAGRDLTPLPYVLLGSAVATARGGLRFGQYRIPDGSGVDKLHVRRRGAETDTFPTARRVLLHLDSQVAHAGFAQ